jgi:isopropylmalate/homocitrate/citramalate synthase
MFRSVPRYNIVGLLMAPHIEIYGTTLRDGTEGEGVDFCMADGLRMAERLDDFGVHDIEGGGGGRRQGHHRRGELRALVDSLEYSILVKEHILKAARA